jgi:hypothetical protein
VYATKATIQLSMCGYKAKLECFSPKEHIRPNVTPRAIEMENDSRKIPIPWKSDER